MDRVRLGKRLYYHAVEAKEQPCPIFLLFFFLHGPRRTWTFDQTPECLRVLIYINYKVLKVS